MRWLLIPIIALLLVPVASARNYKADLSWDGTTVTGCGYNAGDADIYFLWYPSGTIKDGTGSSYTQTEAIVDSSGCISVPFTSPGDKGFVEIWALQENRTGNNYQVMCKITVWLGG